MIEQTKQGNTTSEVHSFQEVICVYKEHYGSQWKDCFHVVLLLGSINQNLGLISLVVPTYTDL